MPSGSYLHLEPGDGAVVAVEEFRCAAGPAGWRYAAVLRAPAGDMSSLPAPGVSTGRVDVTVDAGWRQVRVELAEGGWLLRGGVAGAQTVWLRAPADGLANGVEHTDRAAGFVGRTPGLLVATARRLRLTAGSRARVRLVEVSSPSLGTRVVEQGWSLVGIAEHPTDGAPLPVERYEVADLAIGERWTVHLAGDVVLDAPGLRLHALESPPTLG